MLKEYEKTKGKHAKDKFTKKCNISDMSSGYPPMFDKAKCAKVIFTL